MDAGILLLTHVHASTQICVANCNESKLSASNFGVNLQSFQLKNKRLKLMLFVLMTYPQFYLQSSRLNNFYLL
jgi:hypothetical protein